MADASDHKQSNGAIMRGEYDKSTFSGPRVLLVGLRALDPFLQLSFLSQPANYFSWFTNLFGGRLLTPVAYNLSHELGVNIGGLPPYQSLIALMSVGSTLKQSYWMVAHAQEEYNYSTVIFISVFNTLVNSTQSMLSTWTKTSLNNGSSTWMELFSTSPLVTLGTVLFASGIFVETYSEIQRSAFKAKKENKGKLCTTGLWSVTRHVNYTGYLMWRSGFALAAAGPIAGAVVALAGLRGFVKSSIPELASYLSKKYPAQFEEYKKKTPYVIIPGVI